ncbi:DUF3950 domain-containing protein, partial [Escherichia coli]
GNFSAWVIEACRRRLINENILNLYPTKTNTTRAPVQTGLLKRLIYDTKSDH